MVILEVMEELVLALLDLHMVVRVTVTEQLLVVTAVTAQDTVVSMATHMAEHTVTMATLAIWEVVKEVMVIVDIMLVITKQSSIDLTLWFHSLQMSSTDLILSSIENPSLFIEDQLFTTRIQSLCTNHQWLSISHQCMCTQLSIITESSLTMCMITTSNHKSIIQDANVRANETVSVIQTTTIQNEHISKKVNLIRLLLRSKTLHQGV